MKRVVFLISFVLAGCGARTGLRSRPPADAADLVDAPDVPPDGPPPPACTSDSQCADTSFCNGVERCLNGSCAPGVPIDCGTGDPCLVGSCDEASHSCVSRRVDVDGDGHFSTACGGDDCNDMDATVFGGAPEICDYQDNNCDGQIDEGLAYVGLGRGSLNLAPGFTSAQRPSMNWDGTDFDIVFDSYPGNPSQIFYVAVPPAGTSASVPSQVTNSTVLSTSPALVWTGTEYGLFSHFHLTGVFANGAIALTILDARGTVVTAATPVTSDTPDSDVPSGAWDGVDFGMVYDTNPSLTSHPFHVMRVSASGTVLTPDWQLSPGDVDEFRPATVWTGAAFAVAYPEAGALVVTVLDPAAMNVLSATEVAARAGGAPSMVWTGMEIGVAWSESATAGPLHFARLDAAGGLIDSGIVAGVSTSTLGASLAWNGREFAILYQEFRRGSPALTRLVRIAADERWSSPPGDVDMAGASDGTTALAAPPRGYGAVYVDGAPNAETLLFRGVGCR